ncbi:MAG: FAD-dependent oxidoreductase [Chloroflexi bacterium]|nr:FAD-dependent oxidoreductase [Chloroflexota bacterium]
MAKYGKESVQELLADVLVIGGGLAATAAAIEAAKHGVKVILVDKGRLGVSGSSCISGGGLSPYIPPELGGSPEDSKEKMLRDTVERGFYLNDQKMAELLVEEAASEVVLLDELGYPFKKKADGKFWPGAASWFRELPASPTSRGPMPDQVRGLHFGGKPHEHGGSFMMLVMRKEVLHRGVQVLENVMITRLLKRNGAITGAVGIDTRSGGYYLFRAKSTVLAAGSATKLSENTPESYVTTGDAYAAGYEAGGIFMNMEFITIKLDDTKPKGIDFPQGIGQAGIVLKARAVLYNALGEKFLEKYPWSKEGGSTISRHSPSQMNAFLQEWAAGRGPIYGDVTYLSPEMWERPELRTPLSIMKQFGYDVRKERFELQSPSTDDYEGGLRIGEEAMTNLPGLYSAGESAGHGAVFGAARIAGMALAACMVFGRRAGKYAAERARQIDQAKGGETSLRKEIDRIEKLKSTQGRKPEDLEREVRHFGSKLCRLRDEATLKEAIEAFVRIRREDLHSAKVSNTAELITVLESQNLAVSGEMVARAALQRTESRGYHLRGDYPQVDNKNWLKWVLIKKEGERMKLWSEPVPLQQYKIRP